MGFISMNEGPILTMILAAFHVGAFIVCALLAGTQSYLKQKDVFSIMQNSHLIFTDDTETQRS